MFASSRRHGAGGRGGSRHRHSPTHAITAWPALGSLAAAHRRGPSLDGEVAVWFDMFDAAGVDTWKRRMSPALPETRTTRRPHRSLGTSQPAHRPRRRDEPRGEALVNGTTKQGPQVPDSKYHVPLLGRRRYPPAGGVRYSRRVSCDRTRPWLNVAESGVLRGQSTNQFKGSRMTTQHDQTGAAAGTAPGTGESTVSRMADTAKTEASNVASTATGGAQDVVTEASTQAKAVAGEAKQQFDQLVSQSREELRQQAEQRTSQAAGQLRTLSQQFTALVEGRPEAGGAAGRLRERAPRSGQGYGRRAWSKVGRRGSWMT